MNELFARQVAMLRRLIGDYREGALSLNALIQRIEGIGDVLGIEAWKDSVFPIVLTMEQVNAIALEANRRLTGEERSAVESALQDLEALISRFESAKEHE